MELGKLVDLQFQSALRKLANQELPLRTAFALKGIISNVNSELKKYEEVREKALDQLGSRNEAGEVIVNDNGSVQLSEENMKTFVSQMTALLSVNVTVGTIAVSDLGDKCSMSTSDLMALDGLVTE